MHEPVERVVGFEQNVSPFWYQHDLAAPTWIVRACEHVQELLFEDGAWRVGDVWRRGIRSGLVWLGWAAGAGSRKPAQGSDEH